MKKLIILRRIFQTVFLLLFVYILWSTTYPLTGALDPQTFFLVDPLVMFVTSLSQRVFLPGVLAAGIMVVLTLIFGRFFCGWMCPLGTMIDAMGALRRRTFTLNDRQNRRVRRIKYVLLAVIALAACFGIQIAWIADPLVIAARFVSLTFIPSVTLAINKLFIFFIQDFGIYAPLQDLYRSLRQSWLGINAYYFANIIPITIVFIIVVGASFFLSRAWCRLLCPLGALYGCLARFSLLARTIDKCTFCGTCKSHCRTGAIPDAIHYIKHECILCMDCIYDCPQHITKFTFRLTRPAGNKKQRQGVLRQNQRGVTRREFLSLLTASITLMGFRRRGRSESKVIRPPGALAESDFLDRCIRCGNCMKVCITNGLQPTMLEAGAGAIWTPRLIPEIGYCEYNCTLCMNVCPTGALKRLPLVQKKQEKLGVARVDGSICLAWKYNEQCIVCEEHCPIPTKAVKIYEDTIDGRIIPKPYVDESLCIGCGICQNKCPARPQRAIRVYPIERT